MRFLARFASAADLECFRLEELRSVCTLLRIRNWRIENLSSAGDADHSSNLQSGDVGNAPASSTSQKLIGFDVDDDPSLFVDALIVDPSTAANTREHLRKLNADQPLGNYKNFYCTENQSNSQVDSSDKTASRRQPLNFAIVHFDTVNDAVEVAKRCVLLKGFNLLLGTSTSLEGLLQRMQERVAEEREYLARQESGARGVIDVAENSFTNPLSGNPSSETVHVLARPSPSGTGAEASSWTNAEALFAPLLKERYKFKYHVEGVCFTVPGPKKLEIIQQFAAIPHEGSVSLADADLVFEVTLLYQHTHIDPKQKDKTVPPILGVAYSVPIVLSVRTDILDRYALNKRPYIGTTSMPPELTFLMANLAKVKAGDLCYDPFCGTCSSLITCAHHGALAYGSDIDGLAMRGGSAKFRASKQVIQQQKLAMKNYLPGCLVENGGLVTTLEAEQPTVLTNFKVYGLQLPERLRYDFSLWVTLFDQLDGAYTRKQRENNEEEVGTANSDAPKNLGAKRPRDNAEKPFLFDAIMSDPPYGIREQKVQTTGTTEKDKDSCEVRSKENVVHVGNEAKPTRSATHHTPANDTREDYDISNMIVDLIRFAGVHLAVGKRLVFWHPTTYQYTHDELPRHPYLKIVLAVPQMLSLKFVRVLVVMERVAEPWYPLPLGVTGPNDVTCEVLFPFQKTASLRQLMDTTELDDNVAYDQYKTRRDNKREAVRAYWRQQNGENSKGGDDNVAVVGDGAGGETCSSAPTPCATGDSSAISKRQQSKQKAQLNLENRQKKLAGV